MFRLAGLVLSFSTLCAAKVNLAELEEISDELPERDCFRLLSALNDSEWQINRTHFEQVFEKICSIWPYDLRGRSRCYIQTEFRIPFYLLVPERPAK